MPGSSGTSPGQDRAAQHLHHNHRRQPFRPAQLREGGGHVHADQHQRAQPHHRDRHEAVQGVGNGRQCDAADDREGEQRLAGLRRDREQENRNPARVLAECA
jgi:hypothetical protein